MGDVCKVEKVELQENGIVRNSEGRIIGHLVSDLDALCGEHNKRGYKQGYYAGAKNEREACAKVCDELDAQVDKYPAACANAIRARGNA